MSDKTEKVEFQTTTKISNPDKNDFMMRNRNENLFRFCCTVSTNIHRKAIAWPSNCRLH